MKIVFVFLLLSCTSAFAIPASLLHMKPDGPYMKFVYTKFLEWHHKNFHFPVVTPLEEELISHLDHWYVPGKEYEFQLTVGHTEFAGMTGGRQSLRLFIAPELRKKIEFKGKGIPQDFEAWFVERSDEGSNCLIGKSTDSKESYEVFCHSPGKNEWHFHHREVKARDHLTWKNPFPLMTPIEFRYVSQDGGVEAISYVKALSHISKLPRSLFPVISNFSIDTIFSLERYLIDKDGKMTVFYP